MVVLFWKTNWSELPLIPRVKSENRDALLLRQNRGVTCCDGVLHAKNYDPVYVDSNVLRERMSAASSMSLT